MRDHHCLICKFKQEKTPKASDDVIYDVRGRTTTIPLCYLHSVELFKIGQVSFMVKHKKILSAYTEMDLELDHPGLP